MFESIDQFVAKHISLTQEEQECFHALLKPKTVKKKQFLLKEGEVCDFEAFIVKGCTRTYYIDKEGSETILLFGTEGWWVSDIGSFSEQKPSQLFIETMEECELLTINYRDKELLFNKVPQFERLFRHLVQRALSVLQHRFYAAVSQTAEERYRDFLERYPSVPQRVPQHQIARYLGVSPEFLSKVKSNMYRK